MSAGNGTQVSPTGTAIIVREPARTIEPTNMAELRALAEAAAKTRFFGAQSPEQALLVMMAGRDLGLSYSQALRAFHVIEGKPTLSADGMVAVCLVRRDVCEHFRTVAIDDKAATVATKRVGSPDEQRYTFTIADAQRAGVAGKGTWQKYPSRMLLARARAALARDVYPDLLLGLYDPDELETAPPAPAQPRWEATAPVPAPREELRGEVVPPAAPSAEIAREETARKKYDPEFSRIGREGGEDELRALMRAITREVPGKASSPEWRQWVLAQHELTKAAIAQREPEPPTDAQLGRQPGEDDR